MILCSKCKRVWPQGTKWCGNCRATLGVRVCNEGHESPLDAKVCTTCGSAKLSPGVPKLTLRATSWLVCFCLVFGLGHALVQTLGPVVWRTLAFLLDRVSTLLVGLAFFSFVFWFLFSDNTKRVVTDFWLTLGRFAIHLIHLACRLVIYCVRLLVVQRPTKGKAKD